jgi:hypothetical protein
VKDAKTLKGRFEGLALTSTLETDHRRERRR